MLASVRETFESGIAIIEKKNHDYGAITEPFANFRSAELLGLSVEKAILVRTLDKITRINNLLAHDAFVTEESMDDTIVDAINYLAILKAFREMTRLEHPQPPL